MRFDFVRRQAVILLRDLESRHEAAERALRRRADPFLDRARDRAFLRQLVYGVLENQRYLDWAMDRQMSRPMEKQKPLIRQILRLAEYETLFLHTPAHAVVNEYVTLARILVPGAHGFVNAILRKCEEHPLEQTPDTGNALRDLAIRYSVPDWIAQELAQTFSPDELIRILQAGNQPSPLSLFVVPGRISREEAMERLKGLATNLRVSTISPHLLLCDGGAVTESDLFRNGWITIQSQPSLRVAEIATEGITEGRILDLCAAPGSKTMAMKLLSPRCQVVANDLVPEKLRYMRENSERLHAEVEMVQGDARDFRPEWEEAFDVVLADVPCSGLGLMGRKPDIRWRRRPEDLEHLAELQKEILSQAARYVKPGGRLVYSTCTYGHQENEDVVATLNPEQWTEEAIEGRPFLRFTPENEGSDGFFMARFRRFSGNFCA